ncbi:hypothetical protein MHU86_1370 [Fragilaria crotonensis]|nr:hypothetical protein MHU86_1370 [Fragilaria crotonensis]
MANTKREQEQQQQRHKRQRKKDPRVLVEPETMSRGRITAETAEKPSENSRETERRQQPQRGTAGSAKATTTRTATSPPTPGLEMWIRRPPDRAELTTVTPVTMTGPTRLGTTSSRTQPTSPPVTNRALLTQNCPTTEHSKGARKLRASPTGDASLDLAIAYQNTEEATNPPNASEAQADYPNGPSTAGGGTARAKQGPSHLPEPGTPSKRTLAAIERNHKRVQAADADDAATIGEWTMETTETSVTSMNKAPGIKREQDQPPEPHPKQSYLPNEASAFLPEPLRGPDDTFTPPPWFLAAVRTISATPVATPSRSPFLFEVTTEAAAHNGALLAEAGFDLGRFLSNYQDTTLGYGCEFRPPNQLEPLLRHHPHFQKLSELLTNGMSYHFNTVLTPEEEKAELDAILARGNHKSATADLKQVSLLLAKDVTHGFSVPIPIGIIHQILGAAVQPLGMATQQTLGDDGKPKAKNRLTQDLTFSSQPPPAPPRSINSRIDMEAYPEMVYGWCLPRTIHFIVSLRWHRPRTRVLISKYDSVRFIHHVMKYTSMSIPFHGQMACDNKAIVQQVSTFLPTPVLGNDGQTSTTGVRRHFTLDPLAPEWDLLIEIYHTVCDTWTDTTIQHVKGHQDQDAEKGDLPLLAQLNIEADQLAGQHQRQHPEPSPRARLLPHTGAHLHLPSGTVTSRYDQTLRQTYTSSMSISYLQSRFSWAPDVFATIDWEAHGKALRRQRARHVHFTKLVYDILPTNKVLHRYSASTSPMCPCCLQVEETRDHLLQCTATEEWRQQFISKLDLRCGELNTSPRLRAYLLQCIQDWLRSGDQMYMNNYPAQFRTITETQSAIGWRHLFSGRLAPNGLSPKVASWSIDEFSHPPPPVLDGSSTLSLPFGINGENFGNIATRLFTEMTWYPNDGFNKNNSKRAFVRYTTRKTK